MRNGKRKIALVVPAFGEGGGVPAVAAFLYRALQGEEDLEPRVISLATAASDPSSLPLFPPWRWGRGVSIADGVWSGIPFQHAGAVFGEFEFQQYRPRRRLNALLREFDLVQVVAGAPAWALAASEFPGPVVLQTATLVAVERVRRLRTERGWRGLWLGAMTRIATALEHSALRTVRSVFVENLWMLEELARKRGVANVVFAPPGVDTDFFTPDGCRTDGFILSVGRFGDPRKNAAMLFDAFARLRRAMPSAPKLLLAGGAPSAGDLERAEQLGLAGHIEIREKVSADELKRLYQQAAIFVLSSDEEGLGIVILEAMASGLPVVATRCGGPDTFVLEGETGFLTPVGDPVALAEKLEHLLRRPADCARMGRAGRRRATERFSLAVTAKPFLDEYRRLLQRPQPLAVA